MSDDLIGRLVQLRKERRVTQEELAQDLGVAQATLCRWEKGSRVISPQELVAYAKVLGMRWELVDTRPSPPAASHDPHPAHRPQPDLENPE